MFIGNKLFKQNSELAKTQLTTDDIMEGQYNKYALNYADGKSVGDIVIRFSSEELPCHSLLDGQKLYAYTYKELYDYCVANKQLAEDGDSNYDYYNKTESEYTTFLNSHTWEYTSEHYCPYFVVDEESQTVYEVEKDSIIGYTPIQGNTEDELTSGYVYSNSSLTEVIDLLPQGWIYSGNTDTGSLGYVHLPTIPTFTNGNLKSFYFVVNSSRVNNSTSSIRSVSVGETATLSSTGSAYVRNSGTAQNLILDFGIPSGITPDLSIGSVSSGVYPAVTITGTDTAPILNFVLPKGDKGDAGGVFILNYVQGTAPSGQIASGSMWYNSTTNMIYTYTGSDWEYYAEPNSGVIYVLNDTIYYYDEANLAVLPTKALPNVDETTIVTTNGVLSTVGVKTVTGDIMYDWKGTTQQWEDAFSQGIIGPNHVCFVTDDGSSNTVSTPSNFYTKTEIDQKLSEINASLNNITNILNNMNTNSNQGN